MKQQQLESSKLSLSPRRNLKQLLRKIFTLFCAFQEKKILLGKFPLRHKALVVPEFTSFFFFINFWEIMDGNSSRQSRIKLSQVNNISRTQTFFFCSTNERNQSEWAKKKILFLSYMRMVGFFFRSLLN